MKLYIPVLSCLLMAASLGCNRGTDKEESGTRGFSVTDTMMKRIALDTVKNEKVRNEITLNAKVMAEEDKYVEVFPLVGGYVTSVNVESGDYVRKDDILAVIRSGEVADIERQLIQAKGDVAQAQKNLEVQRDLYNSKLASERDLLNAGKDLQNAEAEMTRIQELLRIYNVNQKSEYIVKAPISGFVTDKKISRDMLLRSDNNQNIFTLAQIDEVWIVANVYESDISRVYEGMEATVRTLSYPDQVFNGKVDKIYNVLDPETRTMKVRITLPNPGFLLKPEMVATVSLFYKENQEYPSVPAASVIFDKSKNFVMVFMDRSHIETREVTVYKTAGERTYISSGLRQGEVIIGKNQLFIYDEIND